MAYNVKFVKGSKTYAEWSNFSRDANTFYHVSITTDANGDTLTTASDELWLGSLKLSNEADLQAAINRIATNESDITSLKSSVETLNGADTVEGSVKKQIADAIAISEGKLAAVATSGAASDVSVKDDGGNFDATDVEAALAELATDISNAQSAGAVTLTKAATATEGSAATYILSQNSKEVGKIEIAKDLVATAGELVYPSTDSPITIDGTSVTSGTYIKMTIANGNPFYINVADLIEYNSVDSTSEIALLQDGTHKITATLVDGGISTAKIADKAVTKAKLDDAVQTSLGLADTSLQASDKTDLESKISTAQSAAAAAQSDVDALETVVGAAADTDAGTAATGLFKKIDDAVAAQATTDSSQNSKIEALESAVGEGGSVSTQIDDAIKKLDTTDAVAIAVQDADDETKINLYTVTETDGIIAQGTTSLAADKAGTAAAVKTALEGADSDTADSATIKGAKLYTDNALTWQEF